jgi:hypothetical protein
MLRIILTVDYEIHGNGEGSPHKLMLEPTSRLLDLLEEYNAKLTIMADVAEILKFREYRNQFGKDVYHYEAITQQLKDAISRGHDVQLHLHCSYFDSRLENGNWMQDWLEYNFAELGTQRLNEVIRTGKEFLEQQLQPINPNYRCNVFRAANWAMSPSKNAVRALIDNGFEIDTSVFKYGCRTGLVNFDYSLAPSELVPWRVDENDICARNANGKLLEFPIYCERRSIASFLTILRMCRAWSSRLHKLKDQSNSASTSNLLQSRTKGRFWPKLHWLTRKHAWKADFNQCSGRQLIFALKRCGVLYGDLKIELPFILIGHSKLFTRLNEWSLRSFLDYVNRRQEQFVFGRFRDFDLQSLNDFAVDRETPVP